MIVPVKIDSALTVRKADLPAGVAQQICERLTIANGAKERAVDRGDWGTWDLPDGFELWKDRGPELVLPRGFAAEFRAGLSNMGHDVRWIDHTVAPPVPLAELVAVEMPQMRASQERGVQEILLHRQGVIQAPTAAGKTVLAIEAWRRAGLRGLIVVGNIGLAEQWRERALEHFKVETGFIGDGQWDIRSLTVAMVQTLRARQAQLDAMRWWDNWGFISIDECHHAIAESYRELLERARPRILIGKTATPLEGDWRQPILTFTLGPVFSTTTEDELRQAGLKLKPLVKVMKTRFKWRPMKPADKRLRDTKAIYRRVMDHFLQDWGRVHMIAETICNEPEDCAQIVPCKSLEYLDMIHQALRERGYPEEDIFFYRGQESRERKKEIADIADEGHCVILATAADEGIDIPRLDRLHRVWPTRKEVPVTQQNGRILRKHPKKRGAIIFDYADFEEPMLRAQFFARQRIYRSAGYAIEDVEAPAST